MRTHDGYWDGVAYKRVVAREAKEKRHSDDGNSHPPRVRVGPKKGTQMKHLITTLALAVLLLAPALVRADCSDLKTYVDLAWKSQLSGDAYTAEGQQDLADASAVNTKHWIDLADPDISDECANNVLTGEEFARYYTLDARAVADDLRTYIEAKKLRAHDPNADYLSQAQRDALAWPPSLVNGDLDLLQSALNLMFEYNATRYASTASWYVRLKSEYKAYCKSLGLPYKSPESKWRP